MDDKKTCISYFGDRCFLVGILAKILGANIGRKAMKTHFKFQIILTVCIFFVIVFNANAQNDHSSDHEFKSKFDHFKLDNPTIDQPHLFDDKIT